MANLFKKRIDKEKTTFEKKRFFKGVKDLATQETSSIVNSGIFTDRFTILFLCLYSFPILIAIVYAYLNLHSLPNQIPLFYSQVWGNSQLAGRQFIFLPDAGAFAFGLINILLACLLFPKNRVIAYLLLGTGSLVSILAAITTFNIINLMR